SFVVDLSPSAIKSVSRELYALQRTPPDDIQIIINETNLADVQAWIRGPDGTPYENGFFKVKLLLTKEFPNVAPKGVFVTKIFHPNVADNGEICVNTLKKDWKSDLGIGHILLTIKCLLIAPNPDSALNEEAGKMLLEAYEDYAKRARLHTSIHAQGGKVEYSRLDSCRKSDAQDSPKSDKNPLSSDKTSTRSISTTSATDVTSKPQSSPKAGSNVLTASTINNITQKRSAAEADLEVKPVVKSQKTAPMDKKKRNLKRL
ncbi:hypothetical protein INT43_003087, partial [Umbelopsis isabellina]